jgi:hypothetical protein
MYSESITGLLQQFLSDGEIDQGRVDVLVAQISGQVKEARLGVDAFAVPREHTVHNKGVPQVMDMRAHAAWRSFNSCTP